MNTISNCSNSKDSIYRRVGHIEPSDVDVRSLRSEIPVLPCFAVCLGIRKPINKFKACQAQEFNLEMSTDTTAVNFTSSKQTDD